MNKYLIILIVWAITMLASNLYTHIKTKSAANNACVATSVKEVIKYVNIGNKVTESLDNQRAHIITQTRYVDKPFYIYVPQDCRNTAESYVTYYNFTNKD